jgi:hypothetical protein
MSRDDAPNRRYADCCLQCKFSIETELGDIYCEKYKFFPYIYEICNTFKKADE